MSSSSLTRFLTLYYTVHFLLPVLFFTLIYPNYRYLPSSTLHNQGFTEMMSIEYETSLLVVVSFLLKARRHVSLDETVQKLFMHMKMLSVLLSFLTYHTLGFYVLAVYAVAYLTVQPSKYEGASKIINLNPVTFKQRVRNPESAQDNRTVWIVSFWADWCESCTFMEPMLSSLSTKYTKKGDSEGRNSLSFAKVDIVKHPELAEEFRIDTSGMSRQLPTVILFYRGVEVKRLPPFKSDGTVVKTLMDEKGVIGFFELDREVEGMSFKSTKARKSGKSGKKD